MFRSKKSLISLLASLPVVLLTACDPPIGPVPGGQPPGSINDTLSVDPGTLPPPPPPPITGIR